MKKKVTSLLLIAAMIMALATTAFAANVKGFNDVQDTDWFAQYVEYAVDHKLLVGTGENTFAPAGTLTRAMFVTVMGRMNGVQPGDIKNNNKFSDIQFDSWYGPYVVWANENGIVDGTSATTFSPNAPVTREQAAIMLYRYMQKMGVTATSDNPAPEFLDMDKVSSWAKEGVNAMRLSGFIVGANGYYLPTNHLTRAQCATIFTRVNHYLETGTEFVLQPVDNGGNNSGGNNGGGTVNPQPQEIPIDRIAFAATSFTMMKDEEMTLFVNYYPANTTMLKAVEYMSSDDSIVDVGPDGVAYAVKVGTATVTATTENGKTATCTVTVQERSVPATSVSFDKTSLTLTVGDSENLVATVSPANSTDNVYSIASSNDEVVQISNGVVTALKEGAAIITVTTTNNKSATCAVTVKAKAEENVQPTSVELNKSSADMKIGATLALTAAVKPDNAKDKSVTWRSSNDNIATVDGNGVVTAKKAGAVTITAKTTNNVSGTCNIQVTEIEPIGITLNRSSFSLKETETATVIAYVAPLNVTNKTVYFSSSNSSVASVDTNGVISAKRVGETTITAQTVNGKTATCKVTVSPKTVDVASLALNSNALTIKVGETSTLSVTVTPDNATDKSVTWTSADPSIATVSNGTVTGVKAGKTTITAAANNGVKATAEVTVEAQKVEIESLTMSQQNLKLRVNRSATLYVTASPANADNAPITWSSSDTSVATVVAGGIVTGVKEGTATITAAAPNGVKATCAVTIEKEAVMPTPDPVDPNPVHNASFELNYTALTYETAKVNTDNSTNIIGWVDGDYIDKDTAIDRISIKSSQGGYSGGIMPMLYTIQSSDANIIKVDAYGNVYPVLFLATGEADKTINIIVTSLEDGTKAVLPVTITRTNQTVYDVVEREINDEYIAEFAAEVLRLVNEARAQEGLFTFGYYHEAQYVLNLRSEELATAFNHSSANLAKWCEEYNIHDLSSGECIASGPMGINTGKTYYAPHEAANFFVQSWLNSSGHRAILMMNNGHAKSICVGFYLANNGTAYSALHLAH